MHHLHTPLSTSSSGEGRGDDELDGIHISDVDDDDDVIHAGIRTTTGNMTGHVTYPGRGQDYVVLPTEIETTTTPVVQTPAVDDRRRRRLCVIGGGVSFVIAVIIIVLCVIVGVLNQHKGRGKGYLAGTLECRLAGTDPTMDDCQSAGCIFNSGESKCYYPMESPYTVQAIDKIEQSTLLTLQLNLPTSNSTKLLIPNMIYVAVTLGNTARIQASLDVQRITEELSAAKTTSIQPKLKVKTSSIGEVFSLQITKSTYTGAAWRDDVIFDSHGCPIVLSPDYIEFGARIRVTSDIVSGPGRSRKPGEDIMVWSSKHNHDLPYFYGRMSSNETTSASYIGAAMNSSAPMRISFSILDDSEEYLQVNYAMLGGVLDLFVIVGEWQPPALAMELTKIFGTAQRPPFWSLGTLVDIYDEDATSAGAEGSVLGHVGISNSRDDSSYSNYQYTVGYVSPTLSSESGKAPTIKTSHGTEYLGTTSADDGPLAPYVDYTYADASVIHDTDRDHDGYNLRDNFPLNHAELDCEENVLNHSPYIRITGKPLYHETLCPDFIHHNNNSIRHRMVHNQYGTLQAKAYSSVSTKRQLILSDSLGLGGGKYAVKSVYVQGDEDHADLIDQMVSTVIWYGMIGMNVIVRLQDGVEDTRSIKHYHLLNTFLPFTAVHEEALLTLDIDTRVTIRAFMTTKLEFFPEWMRVLHLAESVGIPPVMEVSDRFPDYGVLAQGGSEVNSTRRFLIGEKILVEYDMTDGSMPLTVRLPEQSGRSWYHYGDDRFYHKVTGNTVVKEDLYEPMKHYFIASPGILVRSQIDSVDSDMELIKSASLDITIFAGDPREDEFGSWSDSYLLIEGDDDELHLEITVTHNSGGISLVIEPVVKGDGSDARRWGTIQFAEGSLQGIFQGVMMNGVELDPMCYLYHPESDWLGIYMNNDFEENPSLHTRYEINVLYR